MSLLFAEELWHKTLGVKFEFVEQSCLTDVAKRKIMSCVLLFPWDTINEVQLKLLAISLILSNYL